ncbi:MAG: hypothetical protein M3N95_15640 [Actinomycetota bacterium]|nr:hypothetical protein [Actinomycetota bacterium]
MSRTVFVMSDARGVAGVFAHRREAHRFAQDLAGAQVTRHVLWRSADAVVLFDRRVVVAGGHARLDETTQVNHFCDEAFTLPVADVEWYHDDRADKWHVVAFGTDEIKINIAGARGGRSHPKIRNRSMRSLES